MIMSEAVEQSNFQHRDENDENIVEDDDNDQEGRSETGEELNENELEMLKRELIAEVNELEWEFKQTKETLYNERIAQVDAKLTQAKSALAHEFIDVVALVEEAYRIRRKVARYRRDFALEVANKEVDIQLLATKCDASDRLWNAEERIRSKLQEDLCKLKIERAISSLRWRRKRKAAKKAEHRRAGQKARRAQREDGTRGVGLSPISSPGSCPGSPPSPSSPGSAASDGGESSALTSTSSMTSSASTAEAAADVPRGLGARLPLPGPDLASRKKPVSLSESAPCLVYQLPDHLIHADVAALKHAIQERKIARALERMKKKRHN